MSITTIVTILFAVGYFLCALTLVRGLKPATKDLCISGVVIAMTLVLDAIRFPLPTGATISLCSPVPLMLLALVWDKKLAIVSGWACGVLAMLLIPAWAPVHWGQFFVEHMISMSCLGFAGIFGASPRWKALCGITLASVLKLISHTLSGVLFFSQNAWDGWGAWGYSLSYNISQNVPLCVLSGLLVLSLPLNTIRHAIGKETAA